MTKGSYTLRENVESARSKHDSSFKSCLCALLLFLSICLIILFVGLFWTAKKVSEKIDEVKADIKTLPAQTRSPIIERTSSTKFVRSEKEPTITTIATSISTSGKYENIFSSPFTKESGEEISETPSPTKEEGSTISTNRFEWENQTENSETTTEVTGDQIFLKNATETETSTSWNTYSEEGETRDELKLTTSGNLSEETYLVTSVSISDTSLTLDDENSSVSRPHRDANDTVFASKSPKNASSVSIANDDNPSNKNTRNLQLTTPSISNSSTSILARSNNGNTASSTMSSPSSTTALPLSKNKPEPVCYSLGCKSAVSRMLSLMDHSADACDDFYEFACGGMQADPADSNVWAMLSAQLHEIDRAAPAYLQKYATFYESCVEYEYMFKYEERVKKLKQSVEEMGKIYDGPGNVSSIDMTELFAKLILRSSLPFMDVDIDVNKQDSHFVFQLTLPGKSSAFSGTGHWSAVSGSQRRCLNELRGQLRGRNLILNKIHDVYLNCLKNHSIYLNSIETVVRALGVFSHLHPYNQTQRIQELRVTIEWDVLEHMNSEAPAVRKGIIYKKYTVLKVSDLQTQFPLLEWKRFFKLLTGKDTQDNTQVHVYFMEYFRNLFVELGSASKWKLNNALLAMHAHELFETLVVPVARDNREDYCLKLSSRLFADVSSLLYAQAWPAKPKEATEKFFTKMFLELKYNFSRVLQTVEWLDDASRSSALLKVQNLNLAFNKADDSYNNKTYMEEKYSSLNIEVNTFHENFIQASVLRKMSLLRLEGQQFASNLIWGHLINSYDTESYTSYSKKLSIFPLGLLRKYDITLPVYLTVGQIGMAIAREIGRHFDPVGKDYSLNFRDTQINTYKNMETTMKNILMKEIIRSVGKQTVTLKVDPELSMKERIADNTALRLISDYFVNLSDELLPPWIKSTISKNKLFFVAVAQEYCADVDAFNYMIEAFETEYLPQPLRLENIVSNSEFFATTFECPEGSKMIDNPARTQFPHLMVAEDYGDYENENVRDLKSN